MRETKNSFPESEMEMLRSGIPRFKQIGRLRTQQSASLRQEKVSGVESEEGGGGYRWGSLPVSHHPALGQTPTEQQMDNCTLQQLRRRGFPGTDSAPGASDSAPL